MSITREQAAKAKIVLKYKLGLPEWLRGIGISSYDLGLQDHERAGNDDYCIKVFVRESTPEVLAQIPDQVDGVPVLVEAVGDIVALGLRCRRRPKIDPPV